MTDEAYPADVQHLNNPESIFLDSSNNLFVVENAGSRVLKYQTSPNYANLLSLGTAGMHNSSNTTFENPHDVVVDASGNIWVADASRLVEFNASGDFQQQFPSDGSGGNDDSHFNNVQGLALDSAGHLFVSDSNNERIQEYDISGSSPAYITTIGHTGVSGTGDGYFNYPAGLAFDGSDNLYVADASNDRVQFCSYASSTWNCSTFFGVAGTTGTDLTHLGYWINGLTVHGSTIYIADTENQRVLKCNTSAVCSVFAGVTGVVGQDATHLYSPSDVVVDSSGNVYVSEYDNHRVQKFSSAGGTAVNQLGVTRVAYAPDTTRLNNPAGITIGPDGSMYLTERRGFRLVKLNASA